jgi:hypothetical protein
MNFSQRLSSARSRAVLAGLACVLLCSLATAPARAAQVGTNPDITWGTSQTDIDHTVAMLKDSGVKWVRTSVDLSGAEYNGPGQLNTGYLNSIDYAITSVRAAGINVLMEFDRAPYWASADPGKKSDASGFQYNKYWRYSNPQDYANIAADLVNHYKGMGVHAFEVWNEPNNQSFWPSGVDAGQYAALLKAAYPAIKAADPNAAVVMGGLENHGAYAYLQGMYDAGARGAYDVANFHIYPDGDPTLCWNGSDGRPAVNSFCLLDGLHSEMAANGDTAPVWVTELGWSTCAQSYCVTEQAQASDVTKAYQLLGTPSYSYVQTAFAYNFRDLYWSSDSSSWDGNLGLINKDFTPKPAFAALKGAATGAPGTSGPSSANVPVATGSKSPRAKASLASSARAGRVSVTLRLTHARSQPVAHIARVGASLKGMAVKAIGHVRGAAGVRRVTLLLQRRVGGRWIHVGVHSVRLSRSGTYSRSFHLARSAWRISAKYGAVSARAVAFRLV